jgi:hypothetical protein
MSAPLHYFLRILLKTGKKSQKPNPTSHRENSALIPVHVGFLLDKVRQGFFSYYFSFLHQFDKSLKIPLR